MRVLSAFLMLWTGVTGFFKLILPLGQRAGGAVRSPGVRWALHILAVLLVLGVLFVLNRVLGIRALIPRAQIVADVWLPLLFLLVYVLAWLGWWLWTLLTADEGPSYYPDIDGAWDEAVRALNQAGMQVTDLPLFLVLGRPEGPEGLDPGERGRKAEEILFQQAAQLPLVVKQVPATPVAPLHIYASRDALYVTCAGASLLGRQAAILAGEVTSPAREGVGPQEGQAEDPADKTLRPDSAPVSVQVMVGIVREVAKRGGAATDEERRALRRLERKERPQIALLKDQEAVAELTARLRHLCRLIARDRQPYCPINGLLLLVPFAATDSEEDTQNTAEACARDLQTVRGTLKVNCPQFALLSDLEVAAGFREFIGRQDPKDRQRRVGQRFPMGTDLRGQPYAEALDGSIQWLCNNVMREWVYRLFRTEAPGKEEPAAVVASNSKLFLMLSEMWERSDRLSRILTRGLTGSADGSVRFGGTYLGATGQEAAQQAFVAGVFRRLTEAQNYVAWTEEAKAEDARQNRLANLGYSVLAGLGVAVLAVVGWIVLGSGTRRQ